jgi:DNA-binding HxlR family transcriptional regulator
MGEILNRIGDKWSVMIVGTLHNGPVRFNEIKRTINGISQRMLSRTLSNLERDGLVSRTQYNEIPLRVEYELTTLGKSLLPVINELWNWSISHYEDISKAREKFEKIKK